MAATETYILPYKMASLKWDKALVKVIPFTDITIKKLSKLTFKRVLDDTVICEVDTITGGTLFYDNSYPPPTRVNLVKGITEIEIQ